ncbi:MAG: hypothetical protein ACTSRW_06190 [Candidatus Helarchaeota archaeon]
MFHSIYILKDNGVCLYTRHYKPGRADDQLISGFMSAFGSFATEALGSELQSIRLRTHERLSILRY